MYLYRYGVEGMIMIDTAYNMLNRLIPVERILLKEPMKNHTSFRIGGPADMLVLPKSKNEVVHILNTGNELSIPVFVMGNGSNLLVRDKGIRGIVLKISDNYSNVHIDGPNIKAQSGILMSSISRMAVKNGLKGLEFASGIPGTLGGAVTMNAGAYGGEIKDTIKSVVSIDNMGKDHLLDLKGLEFGYRTSCIQANKLIVLEVNLELEYGDREQSKEIMADLARRRREKQPLTYPSAGSTFKRPVGYYAGKLIQDCGLKGLRVGDAQISELHAGFIINLGNATAKDVIELIESVQTIIFDKYGVEMIPEVRVLGEE